MTITEFAFLIIFFSLFIFILSLLKSFDNKNSQIIKRARKFDNDVHKTKNRLKTEQTESAITKKTHGFSKYSEKFEILSYKSGIRLGRIQIIFALIFATFLSVLCTLLLGLNLLISIPILFIMISSFYVFIKIKASKSEAIMLKQLPDALDTIVRNIKTGLPVAEAIAFLANGKEQPVTKVFCDIHDNLKIGREIDEAFEMGTKRFPMAELRFLGISISVQKETGGNMSEIIANLSAIMRQREKLRSKIKAMSSEARASAMIIGSLPFIMSGIIWFINPDYMMKFVDDERGHILAAIGLGSMTFGCIVIKKMINFRI